MVRGRALDALVRNPDWRNLPQTTNEVFRIARTDPYEPEEEDPYFSETIRMRALKAITTYYPNHPQTLVVLQDRADNDTNVSLKTWVTQQLALRER